MKKLLTAGLMLAFCCLAIYLASLTGCSSDRPTETQSTVMSLRDVHFELGSELMARDSAQGIYVDVYRSLDDERAVVVATYQKEDSCVVFVVNPDGTLMEVTKPMSSWTKCMISGIAACRQCHNPDLEPAAYAQCVGTVMMQCAVLTTVFSWFSSSK